MLIQRKDHSSLPVYSRITSNHLWALWVEVRGSDMQAQPHDRKKRPCIVNLSIWERVRPSSSCAGVCLINTDINKRLPLSNKMASDNRCYHSKPIIVSIMESAQLKKGDFHFLSWAVCLVHSIVHPLPRQITTEFASESRMLHNLVLNSGHANNVTQKRTGIFNMRQRFLRGCHSAATVSQHAILPSPYQILPKTTGCKP